MKKQNNFFDNFMWYLLYLLPVFIFLIALSNMALPDLVDYISTSTFAAALQDNFIFNALNGVFGESGVMPLFTGSTNVFLLYYATYFCSVMLLHLCVDFIVFIPRLAHKWLDCLYFGKENKNEK